MFPLNIILNSGEEQGWQNEYYAYYNYDPAIILAVYGAFLQNYHADTEICNAGYPA